MIHDRFGDRKIEHVPRSEVATRVYSNPIQLMAGAITIDLDDETTATLIRQVALDSIPAMRQRVLSELLDRPALRPTTSTLANAVGLPTTAVGRICDDLTALGVLMRATTDIGERRECFWSMTEKAHALVRDAELHTGEKLTAGRGRSGHNRYLNRLRGSEGFVRPASE